MIFLLAFWLFLGTNLAISWRVGDRNDKIAVVIIASAAVSTYLINTSFSYQSAMIGVLAIDMTLCLLATLYAVFGKKYWPLWFAAFILIASLTGLSAIWFSDQNFWIFRTSAGFWAIPALLSMTLGILLDQRAMNARD